LVERGIAYGYRDDYQKKIDDCTAAIKIDPHYKNAYTVRATARKQLRVIDRTKEYEKAIDDYSSALTVEPDVFSYQLRAELYYRLGRYSEAVSDYDTIIGSKPLPGYYYNRANALAALGKYDLALNDFNAALRLDPENYKFYLNRGRVFGLTRKHQFEILDYKMAIKKCPQNPEAHFQLAWADARSYRLIEALCEYFTGYEKRLSILFLRVVASLNRGQY
jgi:tetratricopeptide (TPR) repeat protein